MKGRKPTPASVLERRGAYKKEPGRRKDNPKLGGRPKMPSHLTGYAKIEWRKLVKLLEQAGILDGLDGRALEQYCECYSDWRKAKSSVDKIGLALLVKNDEGKVTAKRNPFMSVKMKLAEQCYKYLVEFGLTPSSRARLEVKADESGSNWFEEALKNRLGSSQN